MSSYNLVRSKLLHLPFVALAAVACSSDGSDVASRDTGAPRTFITQAPAFLVAEKQATFEFSSDDEQAAFECALDGVDFATCVSPITLDDLADGEHQFSVRATDSKGNVDFAPPSVSWTIDTQAPVLTIDAGPAPLVSAEVATITFSSDEPKAAYSCRLDAAPFAPCTSPWVIAFLSNGQHTVTVQAADTLGNTSAEKAWSWTLDAIAPETSLTTGIAGTVSDATANLTFTSDEGGAFECSLDGVGFAACTTPVALASLAEGQHTFVVRAVDTAGNPDATPAAISWTVDTTAPGTSISGGPADPVSALSAEFRFVSDEPGALFACSLDGAAPTSCVSPLGYHALAQGAHTFTVFSSDAAGNEDPSPAGWSWTVDTLAPETTITAAMPGAVSGATAGFEFTSNQSSTFACSLNGAPFAACTSPVAYAGLLPGPQTFEVRAQDTAGNVDATPAFASWVIDLAPPDTTLLAAPASPVSDTTAEFIFAGSETADFECSLNAAVFSACTTPAAFAGLSDGSQTFAVRAVDASGNADPVPATHAWVVDTAPPETTLSPGMAGLVSATTASFTFTANEAARFACRLDGGAFQACSSPQAYLGLAGGAHEFAVRAFDLAGNTESAAEVFGWTVDNTAPLPSLTAAPTPFTTSAAALFAFSSDDPAAVYECSLDFGAFAACSVQQAYGSLGQGPHRFRLRALDLLGNSGSLQVDWVVDNAPPDTTITGTPADPTNATSATFTFAADEASTFECSLDGAAFAACAPPQDYASLDAGSHTWEVRAVDLAGNVEASPASFVWEIDLSAPGVALSSWPPAVTNGSTATFTFTTTDGTATFTCSLDGAAATACASPANVSGLAVGRHKFTVWAIDAAGNQSPASYDWKVMAPDAVWRSVSAGEDFACGVRFDQTLWCWGLNSGGQLGDGTTTNRSAPVQAAGTGWVNVSASMYSTCALKEDGTLWCWGFNFSGQLGTAGGDRPTPTQVGGAANWASITPGGDHTCGMQTDKSLWCWGSNSDGQIGLGSTGGNQIVPWKVAGSWASAGANHGTTCGIDTEGHRKCWGANYNYVYGNGGNLSATLPQQVGTTQWAAADLGGYFGCGIQPDGSLWCWGSTPSTHGGGFASPGRIGADNDWAFVDAGHFGGNACALKTDSTLWCWGPNEKGVSGLGDTASSNVPRQVGAGTESWATLSVGYRLSCAVEFSGELSCWGENANGAIGQGVFGMKTTPVQITTSTDWALVDGGRQSCAIRDDGSLWCWGKAEVGMDKSVIGRMGTANDWESVSTTQSTTCALKSDATVWCWQNGASPTAPLNGASWGGLARDNQGYHSCMTQTDGTLWCFGSNTDGQLGNGTASYATFPLQQVGSATDWATAATAPSLGLGRNHSCAVKPGGTLWCWGDNSQGQLGDGAGADVYTPKQIGTATDWVSVSAGEYHSCAVKQTGRLYCWGLYTWWATSPVPLEIGGTDWVEISSGAIWNCGRKTDGSLWCWGLNAKGNLGLGHQTPAISPQQVGSALDWAEIRVGEMTACAIKTDRTLWCWGDNEYGSLGDGTAWYSLPMTVAP